MRPELAVGGVKGDVGVVKCPAWFRVARAVAAGGEGGWIGAGVHADLCDLVDHGHLASFGLPWWQGPGVKLRAA